MKAASTRITLTPIGGKWNDFFLYSSPRLKNGYRHVSRETIYKGYYSTDFFCETFLAIAGDKVIKVIQGYGENGRLITLYNPFTLITYVYYSMLEIARNRMITFISMFHVKHEEIRWGLKIQKGVLGRFQILCAPSTIPHSSFLIPNY